MKILESIVCVVSEVYYLGAREMAQGEGEISLKGSTTVETLTKTATLSVSLSERGFFAFRFCEIFVEYLFSIYSC